MKATEQYFPLELFTLLFKVVLLSNTSLFFVVLFIRLYKVVERFEPSDETLKYDHSPAT